LDDKITSQDLRSIDVTTGISIASILFVKCKAAIKNPLNSSQLNVLERKTKSTNKVKQGEIPQLSTPNRMDWVFVLSVSMAKYRSICIGKKTSNPRIFFFFP